MTSLDQRDLTTGNNGRFLRLQKWRSRSKESNVNKRTGDERSSVFGEQVNLREIVLRVDLLAQFVSCLLNKKWAGNMCELSINGHIQVCYSFMTFIRSNDEIANKTGRQTPQ